MLAILYIFLNVSHGIELNGSVAFWSFVIYKKYMFTADITYLPFIIGVVIALVQFYPEINSGRLKLTLHLPMKENKILLQTVLIGGGLILFLTAFNLLLIGVFSASYFPVEVAKNTLLTLIPAYLAGLIAYFAVSAIMVEPIWSRRIPMIIFFAGFVSVLFGFGDYTSTLLLFYLITGSFAVVTIILSGFYFKRGIK
jgi:hypothetical protein